MLPSMWKFPTKPWFLGGVSYFHIRGKGLHCFLATWSYFDTPWSLPSTTLYFFSKAAVDWSWPKTQALLHQQGMRWHEHGNHGEHMPRMLPLSSLSNINTTFDCWDTLNALTTFKCRAGSQIRYRGSVQKTCFFSERLKDLKVYQIRIRYENVLVWYIFFRLLKCWSGLPGPPQSFFCLIHLTCPHVSYHQLLSRFASRYMVQGLLPDGPGFWSRLREHQGCWRWEPSAMRFEAFIGTWAVLNPCW